MSNLWRLKQTLSFNPSSVAWPANLQAELILDPSDFFERKKVQDGVTSVSGNTKFTLHSDRAKIVIESTGIAPAFEARIDLDEGYIEVHGNKATIYATVMDLDHVGALIDRTKVLFCQFLSIEVGVFCDVRAVVGKISGRDFRVLYPGLAYSILINEFSPDERWDVVTRAVNLVDSASVSYSRYVTSCLYYQHALRFLSPYEVSFPEFTALPEILLNLSKCIELLFPSASRDELKQKLLKVGYSEEQISSQIISIIILRNEFDVGHVTSGAAAVEDIEILRRFVNRSVQNVRALLKSVAAKIKEDPNFLDPISVGMSGENRRRLAKIEENLRKPGLIGENDKQVFMTVKVS